jgi:hypothetical protein
MMKRKYQGRGPPAPQRKATLLVHFYSAIDTWRSRPLASVCPILYFDALVVKSRQEGPVKIRAV